MSSTEIQLALLTALETLQSEHAEQVEALQNEQKRHYNYYAKVLSGLTKRLDDLTEQLQYNSVQTTSTTQQVSDLASALGTLSRRLKP